MAELSVKGLTFAFHHFTALNNVDLAIRSGEVVGILGENGAGKSTLLNILSGTLHATSGTVTIDGSPLNMKNYREANLKGIWRIFQEPAVIANLPIYENLFLGHEAKFSRHGLLDKSQMISLANRLVSEMKLDVDVCDHMHRYDFATRQALEVGKAILLPSVLGLPAGFVLFDEPTTGLTRSEVTRLLERMRHLKSAGAGVAFVSHRLQEIFDVCDRVVVLKDGAIAGSGDVKELDEEKLHRLMVGRDIAALDINRTRSSQDEPRLVVKDLHRYSTRITSSGGQRAELDKISLSVNVGEIVGIGGLMGSGKSQLLRALSGDSPADDGTVELSGQRLDGSIERRKNAGIAFVSGDRAGESVIGAQSVSSNVSLPSGHAGRLGFSNRLGFWRVGQELKAARAMIADFAIKAAPDQNVRALSGGNQQKVALARWVYRKPLVLLIENPTAGVDVGAKAEIYKLLVDLANKGTSILYVTDDLPELITLSDRILIMRDGMLIENIDNRATPATEHQLVALMIGQTQVRAN